MKRYDLHTHSNISDGDLSPKELVERAKILDVTTIALTDHDTVQGVSECRQYGDILGVNVISGVEISTLWKKNNIHIVGLNIDEQNPNLIDFLHNQQKLRKHRAEQISEKLANMGIENVLEDAKLLTTSEVSRAHFAQVLIKRGVVSNQKQAFKRYLSQGKSAYVATAWCDMETAIEMIHKANGKAVLAHPLRYNLSRRKLTELVADFKNFNGDGLEVAGCGQRTDERQFLGQLAKNYELLASVGSDFHFPCSWRELGKDLDYFDENLSAVWDHF